MSDGCLGQTDWWAKLAISFDLVCVFGLAFSVASFPRDELLKFIQKKKIIINRIKMYVTYITSLLGKIAMVIAD